MVLFDLIDHLRAMHQLILKQHPAFPRLACVQASLGMSRRQDLPGNLLTRVQAGI